MPKTLNIRWLRSFIAIVDQGSASKAAEATGVSQPTVSVHMGKLQDALGRTLFERRGRLLLSEAGEALLPRARRVVLLHDELFLENPSGEDAGERRQPNAMRPAGAPGTAGDAQGAPGPGAVPPGPVRAQVKWFLPEKRYGFLVPEDGSGDLFCHMSAVAAAGLETLPQGALVTCEVAQGDRGPQVSRIFGVDPPAGPGGARVSRPRVRHLGRREASPPAPDPEMRGTVTFYDAVRGFGFIAPDDGGRDVFVPYGALSHSGLESLEAGTRVRFRVENAPHGPQARDVGPL